MLQKLKSMYLRFKIWRELHQLDYKKIVPKTDFEEVPKYTDFDKYIIEQFLIARVPSHHTSAFADMQMNLQSNAPVILTKSEELKVNLRASRLYCITRTFSGDIISGYIPVPHKQQPLNYYLSCNRNINRVSNNITSLVLIEVFDKKVNIRFIRVR